ncbi:hypothetical protein SDJN02_24152, partial [Cucurbita argyrosperma subsp. argyrosperma]
MAQSYESQLQDEAQPLLLSGHRRPLRRWIHLRRKKLSTARLGGRRPPRAAVIWRSIRKVRMRKWLMKVRCDCKVKKINELFDKDNGGFNGFLKRILMEISSAVPVLGASRFI